MTGISPAASLAATHLHVYLHVAAQPGAEESLESEARRMVRAGIGLAFVGRIGGRRDYVPMSLNIPVIASRRIGHAFLTVLEDTRNRDSLQALHAAVSQYVLDATGTDLVITSQHFVPGTDTTKADDRTLPSR